MTNTLGNYTDNGPPQDDPEQGNWIKAYRDMRFHPVVGSGKPVKPADPKRGAWSRGEAWQDLLMEARYRAGRADVAGQTIYLDIGQLLAARAYLAERWNWTEQTVRTFLDRIEQEEMIKRTQPNNQQNNQGKEARFKKAATIITICNYTRYQSMQRELALYIESVKQPSKQPIEQPASNQLATNWQPASNQNQKKERKKEEKEIARERDPYGLVPKYDGDDDVEFDGSKLVLRNGLRSFWAEKFGSEDDLDLALIRAAGYIQANSSRPIRVQVESQLAKQAQEKRDKDKRYAKAVDRNKRQPGKGAQPRSFDDALAESIAAKSGGMPT